MELWLDGFPGQPSMGGRIELSDSSDRAVSRHQCTECATDECSIFKKESFWDGFPCLSWVCERGMDGGCLTGPEDPWLGTAYKGVKWL